MKITKASLCFLFLAHPVLAQFPHPAAVLPSLKASAGYERISLDMPSATRVNLNGFEVDLTDDFRTHFGVAASFGYSRASNSFGSGRQANSLTYLVGPVFYPTRNRGMKTYLRVLVGGARISGPIPLDRTGLWGHVSRPSLAVGGGVEYDTMQHIYIRTGIEYLRTTFFGPSLTLQPQNNIRMSLSVGYIFGGRRHN
jgi:opacity protein-like surface antigen